MDLNKYPESDYCNYDYIFHVIVDGKVKNTFKDKIGKIDWHINEIVVGYTGELLNINSSEDIVNYIEAQRAYWKERKDIYSYWDELFGESMQYLTGIGLLEKNSEERQMRREKLKEIHKLMDEEYKRIEPELNQLSEKYSGWIIDTSDINDLISLGDYIGAYHLRTDDQEQCKEMIQQLLSSDSTLYDRYVEWQGSDEYIRELKVR